MSEQKPTRFVVVDVETNGRYPSRHEAVEVAWWCLTTGERGHFIPHHTPSKVLASADIEALRVNRYIDRIPHQSQDLDGTEVSRLAEALHGNTLAGSCPTFDAGFLRPLFFTSHERYLTWSPQWHHRVFDLAAYAAGVLKLPLPPPGVRDVCRLLAVYNQPDHTAEQDVTATGQCFLELFKRAGVPVPYTEP